MNSKFRHKEYGDESEPVITVEWNNVSQRAYEIDDATVKQWTEEMTEYMLREEHLDQHITYRMSGDTVVMMTRDEDMLCVEVAKRHRYAFIKVNGD